MHFVKPGLVDAEQGRLFHRLFTMRQTGDYDATYGLSEEDVLPNVEPTGRLVSDISELARKLI